ncbi:MAG: hypothetical protein J6A04_00800 [Clostridia bacterium]|nr:hypothetical protein [Clostridia bacterium]
MEENKINLESNQEEQSNQNGKMKIYQLAERIITQTMNKVIRENPNMKDREDIRIATETAILLPLTKVNVSEEIEKEIESIMQVYNTVFNRVYTKYISLCEENRLKSNRDTSEMGER